MFPCVWIVKLAKNIIFHNGSLTVFLKKSHPFYKILNATNIYIYIFHKLTYRKMNDRSSILIKLRQIVHQEKLF